MKSATSFFNLTLMKKNLTRFWPVWALYTISWIYILPVQLLDATRYIPTDDLAAYVVRMICSSAQFGLILAVIYGILTAMAMFSYLYSPRSAGLYHALPVRREGLFLSAYVSGLACMLLPHAVIWLLALAIQAPYGIALGATTQWLFIQSGMCIFFYSFAVFCAVFTGHLLALPLFYGILNVLAGVLYWLTTSLFHAYLYGFAGLPEPVEEIVAWLVPALRMAYAVDFSGTSTEGYALREPWVVAVYAAVGLVLAAIALAVYRHRQVETAGDVVAVPLVRPLFKYGVAVCSCLCFGYWMTCVLLDQENPVFLTFSLLLWAAAGYFVAEMLLRKSFKVLSAWKGCVVLLAVTGACILGLHMDFFGFANRIPRADEVAVVSVSSLYSVPYDSGSHSTQVDLTDPGTIARVLDLHQAVLDQHNSGDASEYADGSTSFEVAYVLKNGSTLSRRYSVTYREDDPVAKALRAVLDDPAIGLSGYRLENIKPEKLYDVLLNQLWNPHTGEFDKLYLSELDVPNPGQAMRVIYDAVMADFAEGNLGRRYLCDTDPDRRQNTYWTDLCLEWSAEMQNNSGNTDYFYYDSVQITLTPQAVHTIQALTDLGMLDEEHVLLLYGEYSSRDKFGDGFGYYDSNGDPVPPYDTSVEVPSA